MKKFWLLLLACLTFTATAAQLKIYDLKNVKLEQETDYKNAESVALEVANLLLSMPIDNGEAREEAIDFLYNWMIGTPDYLFGTGRMRIILGEDHQVIGISFAAQVKYALENKISVRNEPTAQKEIWNIIAQYISDKENNVTMTPKLKELCRAYKFGQIDEFIKRHE